MDSSSASRHKKEPHQDSFTRWAFPSASAASTTTRPSPGPSSLTRQMSLSSLDELPSRPPSLSDNHGSRELLPGFMERSNTSPPRMSRGPMSFAPPDPNYVKQVERKERGTSMLWNLQQRPREEERESMAGYPEIRDTQAYLYSDAPTTDDTKRFYRRSAIIASRLAGGNGGFGSRASIASSHGHGNGQSPGSRKHTDLGGAVAPALLAGFGKERFRKEEDDALHDPGSGKEGGGMLKRVGPDRRIVETRQFRGRSTLFTWRLWGNLGMIALLLFALIITFLGYPVYRWYSQLVQSTFGAAGLGGTNSTGQVADVPAYRGLIDQDTPESAWTRKDTEGKDWTLVFSDEFETDGRTFYDGDDPYWTAVDLHYHQTGDLEWYDPDAITTKDGYLQISLTKETSEDSHGQGYLSGMLQSWNKLCFTGGYVEVAISLPGDTLVQGLWPAAWMMGNLGRAGYGASLEGLWPYSYQSCDVGTLINQTDPTTNEPAITATSGTGGGTLSYLPGQRLSACTCPGELHPGPTLANGSFVGRSSPEIDIFEATVNTDGTGSISQSAQWAPFNPSYEMTDDTTPAWTLYDTEYDTFHNSYIGGVYQQVTSALSTTDPATYNSTTNFMKYGVEYQPSEFQGQGTGYISWHQNDEPMAKIMDTAMGADANASISDRPVTAEPMYIIMNLGLSYSFGNVDLDNLVFPSVMRVDHVRVYQRSGFENNVGCSPKDYPTADYIAALGEAYTNPNTTVYADLGYSSFPKNRLIDTCS